MNYLYVTILGIVEGVTEFLPISSTFHLIWTSKILNLDQNDYLKSFEVIIQSGAILAILFLYAKDLIFDWKTNLKIIYSFIPTAIVGIVFYPLIKNSFFEDYQMQILIFTLIGLIFLFFESYYNRKIYDRKISEISVKEALFVGLMQSLAIFPGVSRAGAVILAMMILKVKRSESAKYSFLLALPTLISAGVVDLYKVYPYLNDNTKNLSLLLVGFGFSFVSAFIVARWFVNYLKNNNLMIFAYYRISIAILLALFFLN